MHQGFQATGKIQPFNRTTFANQKLGSNELKEEAKKKGRIQLNQQSPLSKHENESTNFPRESKRIQIANLNDLQSLKKLSRPNESGIFINNPSKDNEKGFSNGKLRQFLSKDTEMTHLRCTSIFNKVNNAHTDSPSKSKLLVEPKPIPSTVYPIESIFKIYTDDHQEQHSLRNDTNPDPMPLGSRQVFPVPNTFEEISNELNDSEKKNVLDNSEKLSRFHTMRKSPKKEIDLNQIRGLTSQEYKINPLLRSASKESQNLMNQSFETFQKFRNKINGQSQGSLTLQGGLKDSFATRHGKVEGLVSQDYSHYKINTDQTQNQTEKSIKSGSNAKSIFTFKGKNKLQIDSFTESMHEVEGKANEQPPKPEQTTQQMNQLHKMFLMNQNNIKDINFNFANDGRNKIGYNFEKNLIKTQSYDIKSSLIKKRKSFLFNSLDKRTEKNFFPDTKDEAKEQTSQIINNGSYLKPVREESSQQQSNISNSNHAPNGKAFNFKKFGLGKRDSQAIFDVSQTQPRLKLPKFPELKKGFGFTTMMGNPVPASNVEVSLEKGKFDVQMEGDKIVVTSSPDEFNFSEKIRFVIESKLIQEGRRQMRELMNGLISINNNNQPKNIGLKNLMRKELSEAEKGVNSSECVNKLIQKLDNQKFQVNQKALWGQSSNVCSQSDYSLSIMSKNKKKQIKMDQDRIAKLKQRQLGKPRHILTDGNKSQEKGTPKLVKNYSMNIRKKPNFAQVIFLEFEGND